MASRRRGILDKLVGVHPEDELREGFQIWAQGLPYPRIVCDHLGKIIDMNEAFVSLIGHSREEMEMQRIYWFLPKEEGEALKKSLATLEKNQRVSRSFTMDAAGEEKEMELTIVPIEREGEILGQYWLFSEGAKALSREKEQEPVQAQGQVGGVPKVGTWTYDFEREEFYASGDTYQIFGRSPEAFDGSLSNVLDFLLPEDRERFSGAMERSHQGVPLDIDFGILTAYGYERRIRAKAEMFHRKDGTPDKMIGTVQDLTESYLIEKNFEILRDHLLKEERSITGSRYRIDLERDEVELGDEAKKIFGLDPDRKVFDRSVVHAFIHPEDRKLLTDAVKTAEKGEPFDVVYRVMGTDEQVHDVRSRGKGVFEKGRLVAVTGTLEDITQLYQLRMEAEHTYKELREAQETFRMGSWTMDLDTRKLEWSAATFEIYGMDPDQGEPTFEDFLEKIHVADRGRIQEVAEDPPEENPFEMAFRIYRVDGTIRYLKHLVETVYEGERPRMMRGNVQDVTEQQELEDRVRRTQEEMEGIQKRYQMVLESTQDIVEIIDASGRVKYISPTVRKMMGYTNEDIVGHRIWEFVEGEEKDHLKKLVALSVENPRRFIEGRVHAHTKDGRAVDLQLAMNNHLADPEIHGIILNWKDVTEEVRLQKELHYLADYDEMTDLPNRSYFGRRVSERIEEAKVSGKRLGIFMIDIDGFKDVSDALGMSVGDELIRGVGDAIRRRFHGTQAFLARYYGDQFALLIDCMDGLLSCRLVAEQILSLFHEPFQVGQYELNISASIGFSVYPEDGKTDQELIKNSNIALNRAKKEGKGRYQAYSSHMDVRSFKEFSLRNDLKRAIEEDQLVVHFQPIIKLSTGEILGIEALTRWEHPEWGMVDPDEFIPIAENTGLIIPMGHWILDRVCRTYRDWLAKGLPAVKLAVNYSGVQFFQRNFTEDIVNTLADYQIDPHHLILEITESVLLDQGQQTKEDLKILRSLGIQIAIDDFGTGYSSFAYLHTMEVDILKIDHKFLSEVPDNESSKKILKAIIGLAKDLKMKIVAEGVENWDQLLYLRRLNCLVGQGNLYQRAIPAEKLEPVLRRRRIRPQRGNDATYLPDKERRKYYRVEFLTLLEADMTILEINGKKTNVGNTKCLVRNIGPGGLCFITNINFPLKRDLILQFGTELMGKVVRVHGTPVWREELELGIMTYGLAFTIDENARMELTGLLNQVQIRVKNDVGFNDGRFIATSMRAFFHKETSRMEREREGEL